MKPFFSVIIPTYNQCKFLKKALLSVKKQTFNNYEIIIIDNHSNDGTREYIKSLKKKVIYKKIKNKGVIAKSRNLGLRFAKGSWISFLDSDDIWHKDKLKKTFDKIKKNNFDIICNDEWIKNLTSNSKKIWTYGPFKKKFYKSLLLYGNRNSTSATTVKKNFLSKNKILFNENKNFITAEDYEFFLKIAFCGGIFYYLNIPLGVHVFHSKSESAQFERLYEAQIKVLKHHIFNVQKFENKTKLWKKVESINKIKLNIFYFRKFTKLPNLFLLILLVLKNPISSLNLFKILFEKFIKQYILKMKFHLNF
jgi:glycosyltransferase involved in cell wall biosynthesis